MPLIITHPETNPEIRKLEHEIAEKKAALAKLIQAEKGKEIQEYTFLDKNNISISLAELFGTKTELIIVFYMGIKCKYCTLWADNYNGISAPLNNRAAFAVISHETPDEQTKIKASRNWNFEMYSRMNNSFAQDLGFADSKNSPSPGIASFSLKGDKIFIHHRTLFGPGDNYCNMWDFINILPSGLNDWQPKYNY